MVRIQEPLAGRGGVSGKLFRSKKGKLQGGASWERPSVEPFVVNFDQLGPLGYLVLLRVWIIRVSRVPDNHLAGLVRVSDLHNASLLSDGRIALRCASLEQLHDPRQTLSDVVTSHTTGVEGPHRQLITQRWEFHCNTHTHRQNKTGYGKNRFPNI